MMAEQGEEIEMGARSSRNKADDPSEKKGFERSLKETLEEGDVDDITDKLTPRALTKCNTNALLMAMEVNFELRRLAAKKGPDEDDFTMLANSVDEFTSCLLDPLKSNTEDRNAFEDSLDNIVDKGIELEQKKFFAHPVMYNLMKKKWRGTFGETKRSSWLDVGQWTWLFLNVWCLFDLILFPFLFGLFYIKHQINKASCTRRNKEIDLAFVINATSHVADQAFELMRETIKYIMNKHKNQQVKYQVVIHGVDSSSRDICFTMDSIKVNSVDHLTRNTEVKLPALHEDLEEVRKAFELSANRPNAEKVLVLLTDHKTCLRVHKECVKDEIREIKKKAIKLVPVGIGPHIKIRDLERINNDGREVMHFGEYTNPKSVGNKIWHELQGKDMFASYLEYFTTPYFVFIRDTLSYLALLGLHFALCLETSSISFSGLEWAILVFFLGRILMESRQFLDVKVQRKRRTETKNLKGSKYEICDGTEDDKKSPSKLAIFLERCNKYLSDRWNILDFITLLNYTVTFVLRVVTWSLSESVNGNRALVIAGYLYGLNTMFLTLRAFGHVMETVKGVGTIQIALFHIIGDVITIFWQFIATILAFSIAITKVYMAERSFISSDNGTESACKTSNGLACWWSMVRHLTWSLLGIAELDHFDSVDSASVTLARLLFGVFLVMGVILLVNMMIALLSNTYQRVEDNSLKEWSFKKAITIQTYSAYHPIPVPLNLISHLYLLIRWCTRGCKRQQRKERKKTSLDAVVENLQDTYFSKYGYSFPLTDERKMDQVLQETERNRQMANQIAYRTFTAHGLDEGIFPTGPTAWESQGIRVHGCLLSCEGSEFCSTCKDDPSKYHGARYKFPFTPEFPYFEVLIQETGERKILGVGVVGNNCGNHALPGWFQGTVGYHVDDGRIFDAFNCTKGVENEDAMAYRGDVIGCTVKFDLAEDGKVPIVFSLNGRQITQKEIFMEYSPNEKFLYPYIGMGQAGIRVLAKMCSHQDVGKGFKIPEIDGSQLFGEELDYILKTLEKMENKLQSNFQETVNGIDDIHKEIRDSDERFRELVDDILCCFETLEGRISYEIEKKKSKTKEFLVFLEEMDDPVDREDLSHLCEMDKTRAQKPTNSELLSDIKEKFEKQTRFEIEKSKTGEFPPEPKEKTMVDPVDRQDLSHFSEMEKKRAQKPTNSELLSVIKEKTIALERTSDDKFGLVFKAIRKMKESQQDTQQNLYMVKESVQKRFNEHEEFIRTNLPIPQ